MENSLSNSALILNFKNKHFNNLVNFFSVFAPIILIQLYLIDNELLPLSLLFLILFTLSYFGLFFYGLIKVKVKYILPFLVYVLVFVFFFMLVRHQNNSYDKTDDNLIVLIEQYKIDNGWYPSTIIELEGKYINKIPKIWQGIIPSNYLYYYDFKNKSFSLTHKFSKGEGKTWQSSLESWDYYGE